MNCPTVPPTGSGIQYTTHLDVHHKFSTSHYKLEPKLPPKMRLTLHTVICCCVFTTVLPLVKGATGELNTSLKKRFKVWLQSRMKRDLDNSLGTSSEQCSDIHVGPQQDGSSITDSPPSSFGLNVRSRRSTSSKSSGCALVTCIYHDLVHRLHQVNSEVEKPTAPEIKISPKGYGRKRRSVQDVMQLALQTGRRSTEAASKVCLAAEIQDNP
ncbi:ADM Adrenomedullin [Larimichthys crocea]|uniref:ADM Adrenomedullin n=2 Tax=Larimichthys crocea TaxID=215358 RepID=A0A6G0IZI5_LARCR|nr:ADM Adrenomedullin [Larimichthys crocea]